MSVVQTVFLKRADLPAPRVWQAAITAAGFDVQIDADFDPRTHSGFLPATHHGKPGGFEYELDQAMNMEGVEGVEGLDAMVAFITHADLRELATAVVAAAVLAHLTGGVLLDEAAGETMTHDQALAWAREVEAELLPELEG